METTVPSPEISYLWLGEATIGCPTLFFGLVSWGDEISPLRAGTEGSRLAYKRASQHTVATIGLKGLKNIKNFIGGGILLHWTLLEISGSRNLDDTVLFLEWAVILIGLDLSLSRMFLFFSFFFFSRMFLNDLRAHYGYARFSSASTKFPKSIMALTTADFWFHVRTNGRGPQISAMYWLLVVPYHTFSFTRQENLLELGDPFEFIYIVSFTDDECEAQRWEMICL